MTQATELLRADTASGGRLVLSVSAAHFVSHYYILLLPPLFEFVRADYGIRHIDMPASAARVWAAIHEAEANRA
jgi:hypothetical protein